MQAAQALDIDLGLKRSGQYVYFWVEPKQEVKRRRGRPPQAQESRSAGQEQYPISGEQEAPVSEVAEIAQEEAELIP